MTRSSQRKIFAIHRVADRDGLGQRFAPRQAPVATAGGALRATSFAAAEAAERVANRSRDPRSGACAETIGWRGGGGADGERLSCSRGDFGGLILIATSYS